MVLIEGLLMDKRGFFTWSKKGTFIYTIQQCFNCGTKFFGKKKNLKHKAQYCKRECFFKAHSRNISGAGHHNFGKVCPFKGRPTRLRGKKLPHRQGPNSHFWNPTLTDEDRKNARDHTVWKEWRLALVKERDFTCEVTGYRGGILHVHHIDPWAKNKERRYDKTNCVVLAVSVHKLFHKLYGTRNTTPSQWEEFLKNKPWERINGK